MITNQRGRRRARRPPFPPPSLPPLASPGPSGTSGPGSSISNVIALDTLIETAGGAPAFRIGGPGRRRPSAARRRPPVPRRPAAGQRLSEPTALIAARPASSRATGTRNGEQDT
ncbi:hypothetical protein GCM10022416_51420 [Actinomadura keratinilytica]|uniref:Uncharacterized protein n=1 Tax=Actinomadura keratinilytica TaxID=547461 RepID=A0ABP7ZBV6_9ACTN